LHQEKSGKPVANHPFLGKGDLIWHEAVETAESSSNLLCRFLRESDPGSVFRNLVNVFSLIFSPKKIGEKIGVFDSKQS
jgi:hypothetical protein